FGNSLGSSTTRPKDSGEGHQYGFDTVDFMKTVGTFGLDRPPGRKHLPVEFSSVGYFEDDTFKPERWKPNIPNPAFQNMTARDGYWAAKIVASFTDADIAAAVSAGRYSNKAAERQVTETLKHRRDRIANYWFRRVAPVDRFRVEQEALMFDDLAIKSG